VVSQGYNLTHALTSRPLFSGTKMADSPPLIRQWMLLRTLCARHYGATVKDLAAEMAVSEKTIRRDLETFRTVGFPLIEEVGQFGRKRYRIAPDKNLPGMSFTYDEAIALYLAQGLLAPLSGTIFWEAAQRAFKKVRSVVSEGAITYIHRFAQAFHQTAVGRSDYSRKAELIDTILQGIEDRRVTFITYRSLRATEPVTYDVYPYGLAYHRGALYLVGRAPQYDEIRHWKVDRIEKVQLEELRFNPPANFDLRAHFAKSFGVFHGDGEVCIKVRFAPAVARYVQEGCWHPSQKLAQQKDGGLLAEFHLSSSEEIKHWILSFGRHAEVLAPPDLRQEMAEEIHTLLALYQAGKMPQEMTTKAND